MAYKVYVILLALIGYFHVIITSGNWYLKHFRRWENYLYREDNTIQTATAYYNSDGISTIAQKIEYTNETSILLSNAEFKSTINFKDPFLYADTEKIDKQAVCIPSVFGYPEEKGLIVFPEFQYPDCSTLL